MTVMALQTRIFKYSLTTALCVGFGLGIAAAPALAGFNWTPEPASKAAPIQKQTQHAMPMPDRMMAQPQPTNAMPPSDQALMPMPATAPAAANNTAVSSQEPQAMPMQNAPAAMAAQAAPMKITPPASERDLTMPPAMTAPMKNVTAEPLPQTKTTSAPMPKEAATTQDKGMERYRSMYGTIELEKPKNAAAPMPKAAMNDAPAKMNSAATAAKMAAIEPAAGSASADIVEGFGSDMPLAFALRQVVPAQYAFSFGNGVNPGVRVSWNGGKAWADVVRDMVAPLGMQARIEGHVVHISTDNGGYMPMSAPAAQRPAMPKPAMTEAKAGDASAIDTAQNVVIERKNIVDPGYGVDKTQMTPSAAMDDAMMTPMPPMPATPAAQPPDTANLIPLLPAEQTPAATAPSEDKLAMTAPASTPARQDKTFDSEFLKVMRQSDSLNTPPAQRPMQYARYTERMEQEMAALEPAAGSVESEEKAAPPAAKPMAEKKNSAAGVWEAAQGQSLRDVLTQWSRQAGISLVWEASHDYQIGNDVMVSDSFHAALRSLFTDGLPSGDKPSFRLLGKGDTKAPAALIVQDTSSAG